MQLYKDREYKDLLHHKPPSWTLGDNVKKLLVPKLFLKYHFFTLGCAYHSPRTICEKCSVMPTEELAILSASWKKETILSQVDNLQVYITARVLEGICNNWVAMHHCHTYKLLVVPSMVSIYENG